MSVTEIQALPKLQSYSKQKSIGTYSVDKSLIQNVEDFLKLEVPSILNWPAENSSTSLTVTLIDSHGEERYLSIKDYRFPLFRNDTKAVTISYTTKVEDRELKLTLRLGKDPENTDLAISLALENAREKVAAIEQGLLDVLSHSKNYNLLYFPAEWLGSLLGLGCFLSGILAFAGGYTRKERFIFGIVACVGFFYLVIAHKFKSYCDFDTNLQQRLDKWFLWLVTGFAGFLLFSTLLPAVRKELFGW